MTVDLVLNWLWQGAALAVGAAIVLGLVRSAAASGRCAVVWVALAAVLSLPLVPALWSTASPLVAPTSDPQFVAPLVVVPGAWWTATSVLAGAWGLWVAAQACRLAFGLLALRRAARRCRPVPAALEKRLRHWTAIRTTGRTCPLTFSDDVRAAAVLGWGAPVIAIAPALARHLDADAVDRIVVHEWAHVQRRDDLATLIQAGVRVLAGWHPAVWWLDRRLNVEREMACDEMVVALTKAARAYAASLATLASWPRSRPAAFPALAASSSSGLRQRVARILASGRPGSGSSGPLRVGAAGAVLGVLALAVGGMRLVEATAAVPLLEAVTMASGTTFRSSVDVQPARRGDLDRARSVPVRRADPPRALPAVLTSAGAPTVLPFDPPMVPPTADAADVPGAVAVAASPTAVPVTPHLAGPVTPVRAESTGPTMAPIADRRPVAPWTAAAEGGAVIGRGSQQAAVATAAFVTRFGRKIADVF